MFPSPKGFALEVEFYCAAHRVRGFIHLPSESHRLTDLLNNGEESLHLKQASVFSLGESHFDDVGELTLEKQTVRVAVPRETQDFLSRHRLTRAGMARPELRPVQTVILLPPFTVRGMIFAGPGNDHAPVERSRLSHFASLSAGSIYLDDHLLLAEAFMAINRDAVAGIGRLATKDAPVQSEARPATAASAFLGTAPARFSTLDDPPA